MFLNKTTDIYIPLSHGNLSNFRQTMGHKLNHSFKFKNTKFAHGYHPRFGKVRTVVATTNIQIGQELLVSYGYQLGSHVPEWYAELYKKEMGQNWYKPAEQKQNQCQQRQSNNNNKMQQQNQCGR